MAPIVESRRNSWPRKFRCAARGAARAIGSERNFRVHLAMAVAVTVVAAALGASLIQWCVLILCIGTVLAAEMFNTAIEHLARAIAPGHSEEIRDALDVGAGAVLVAALGAATVGGLVFVHRFGVLLDWW